MSRIAWSLTRHPVGLLGAALSAGAGLLLLVFFGLELTGHTGSPYLGILTFMVLPAFFVMGLVMMPLGFWLQRRRAKRAGREPGTGRMLVVDLNNPVHRRNLLILITATLVNVAIVAVATYHAVEVMESDEFCGTTCHSVMAPEYTTYKRSPHAKVGCVQCHIGSGAGWFVKSKISGSWQMVSVTLDLYPRPIPTPVHSLRPARDTCEKCHWPTKFLGDTLKVFPHFESDEENTETSTVLMLKVGGSAGGKSHGIHWHVDPENRIRYRADEGRQEIYEVELTTPDGETRLYLPPGEIPEEAGGWREMDCLDCHNRPSHIYRFPAAELDKALMNGEVSSSLPYIKREGMNVLEQDYESHAEAEQEIHSRLDTYYRENYPEVLEEFDAELAAAKEYLVTIYNTNVFPQMNIVWGTYLSHLGHEDSPGCFRCHNDEHVTENGEVISQDCDTCHTLLAMEEEDPEILQMLRP
jgi:hypothetical protein